MPPLFFWSIASISFFSYTQLYYQTIRIFARACSGKNLLLMLSPDACQFAAGMYRIAPLSFLHLFSFSAHITPEKGRFGELLSRLPIKFGNKEKSAFLPYSCLDIIQLGMKKRTAVIYRRPFLVIPNCRVKPSAEPLKRKTPKSFRDFSVFPYLVGVSGFEPEASWTRTTSMHRSRDARGEREPQSWRLAWYLNLFAGLLTAPFLLPYDRMYWVLALTLS